jgi:hypothetical protein
MIAHPAILEQVSRTWQGNDQATRLANGSHCQHAIRSDAASKANRRV